MSYTIPKGKHRVQRFPTLVWAGPKRLIFRVCFDGSWRQSWPGDDKDDVNKLIGIGCLNLAYLLKGRAPHHWKSTRLGVDYNEDLDVMDAYEYIYHKGVRFSKKVFEFQFYVDYHIHVYKLPDKTEISICDTKDNEYTSFDGPAWRGVSYLLKPYMGGDNPARRDTKVDLKRL